MVSHCLGVGLLSWFGYVVVAVIRVVCFSFPLVLVSGILGSRLFMRCVLYCVACMHASNISSDAVNALHRHAVP